MPGERRHFEIVHAGAPERPVGKVEAGWFYDIDRYAEASPHPKDRAGVAGDVGLVQSDSKALGHVLDLVPIGCRTATPPPSGWKSLFEGMAISDEIIYRSAGVNPNRWRQRWSSTGFVTHWLAQLTGALPDGGFRFDAFPEHQHHTDSRRNVFFRFRRNHAIHPIFPKGPSAPTEPVSSAQSLTAGAGGSKPTAGLSAAFEAALGAKLPEPHVKLSQPHAFDPVAQAKTGSGNKAPKPVLVRNSATGPRTGHK
jgi:hypothetical protein